MGVSSTLSQRNVSTTDRDDCCSDDGSSAVADDSGVQASADADAAAPMRTEPLRGSAYRCIRINGKMDPLVLKAAGQCNVPLDQLRMAFPPELTIWVDPGEVSVRFGEDGSIGMVYSGEPRNTVAARTSPSHSRPPIPPCSLQQPQQLQHHQHRQQMMVVDRMRQASPVIINRNHGLMLNIKRSPLSTASTPDELYSSFAAAAAADSPKTGLPYSGWSEDLVVGRYASTPVKIRGRCLFQDAPFSPVHSPITPPPPPSNLFTPSSAATAGHNLSYSSAPEMEFAEEPLNQQCKALAERLMFEGGLSSMLMATNFNGSPLDAMVGVS
ncbi:unnamed protein product [Soboliphyme baturini]|uniref:Anti_prolifrtn domain-containing protein n=1 Tax=Soboliphyme baturini TaxID=241478 RepID=A0A183IYP6_9BILA|nr:unnamed protein product [Soboliphyme baturini]